MGAHTSRHTYRRTTVVLAGLALLASAAPAAAAKDTKRPALTITSPKPQEVVSGVVTLKGRARDDTRVRRVTVRVDSGPRLKAKGRKNWRLELDTTTLSEGPHTLTVRAVDAAGKKRTRKMAFTVLNLIDGRPVVPVPLSIPALCTVDVTDALNDFFETVPDNSAIVFPPGGCYRTERSLRLEGRSNLTIEGNGSVFKRFDPTPPQLQWPEGNRHWWFLGGGGLIIRNVRVEGTNTVPDQRPGFGSYDGHLEFEHAFAFHGVQGVTVEGASADAIWGDGMYFGPHTGVDSADAHVNGFVVDRNGRQGVAMSGLDGGLFENVQILHGRRAGFDLEPPPCCVLNIEIRDSYTNTIGLAFASGGVGDVSNISIHHNTIDGPSVPWVYVSDSKQQRRSNWTVTDNTVLLWLGSPAAALLFDHVDNVEIARNYSRISTAQSRDAVSFRSAGGLLRVIDNDFTGACAPYEADAATGPVIATGNIISQC